MRRLVESYIDHPPVGTREQRHAYAALLVRSAEAEEYVPQNPLEELMRALKEVCTADYSKYVTSHHTFGADRALTAAVEDRVLPAWEAFVRVYKKPTLKVV